MNKSNSDQPDQIVVVVHGVGDPQQGHTLSQFARSIADTQQPFAETPTTIWLREKSGQTQHVQTFPVQQTRVHFANHQIELCEAFWGDISRVGRGMIGVLRGLFEILFGMRYVAYVAADQTGTAARWLKTLGLMSARILQGPVLAVSVFLGLLIAAVCGTHVVWQQSSSYANWPPIIIAGCSAFVFVAAQIGARITRSRVIERFWFWMNATSGFVFLVMLLRLFWLDVSYPLIADNCEVHPGVMWYCRILVVLLGLLWFVETQVVTAMAACWFLAVGNKKNYRPGLALAFLLPALAVGFWGQAIPVSWLALKESVGTLAHLKAFAKVFDDAIPFLGVQMVMLVVLMLTLGGVLLRYLWWRSTDPTTAFANGSKAPRLIVHRSLKIMLTVCTGVGVVLVSSLWLMNTFGQNKEFAESGLASFLATANGFAISAVVPLGGLFIFFLRYTRPGFDMILDVVNHFYFRPTSLDDVLDDDDEFDISETTFQNGQLFFSRRDALHDRLRRILAHYRDRYRHQPDLVIISHSQGTMIAIETLNEQDLDWLNNAFGSVTLITMGSPFSHLYQHYFGHLYPPLSQPFWAGLRQRVDRWVNVFRVDDYVGNEINFPSPLADSSATNSMVSTPGSNTDRSSTQSPPAFISQMQSKNIPVGPRGHVSYWTDREVLEHIRNELYWNPHSSPDLANHRPAA